jgi:hypothetical protein
VIALLVDVHRRGILLATSHGGLGASVGGLVEADGTLERGKDLQLCGECAERRFLPLDGFLSFKLDVDLEASGTRI